MSNNTIVEIKNAVPRLKDITFKEPVNWSIENDQHWAVIGPNGGGKTLLIDLLTAKYALKSGEIICKDGEGKDMSLSTAIKSVAFRDIYSLSDIKNSYYQQRWNAGDIHDVPVVREFFKTNEDDQEWLNFLIEAFGIDDLIEKEINLLSSGELRKFLIVRTLLKRPRILILDNPYIGLDAKSRNILNDLFDKLAALKNLQIVLVLSNPNDIANMITHVLPVKDKTLKQVVSREDFVNDKTLQSELFPKAEQLTPFPSETNSTDASFEHALVFNKIFVKYGLRTILYKIDWQVKRGEKWALLGENGAGKSTLLSLVSGDNPQAYSNDITLFDRKRGSGESIWDIKKRIGYISPEMHLYYLKNVRSLDIVGSGFFDTIGLYRKCNEEQEQEALRWMKIFNIEHLKDVSFLNVSSGEQRLILLARLFVKNPDLLILDEPLHGLDVENKRLVKSIIEEFCSPQKALIYVTHYEDEIPSIVDNRLVLKKYLG